MSILNTTINPQSESFIDNRDFYLERIKDLYERRHRAHQGGPEKARLRHTEHRKQILPRDRISLILDPGSPFFELGELAGDKLPEGSAIGASLITGVGLINGRQCMIIVNDATVKGGTYYPMTCKKHVRAQTFAIQHRLPCITMVQSGGAFLPEQEGIFPDEGMFGSIFVNQIEMSGQGIPQISIVMGSSTAGGAYIPALCDEIVIVRGKGFMYLGGPQLVEAATGEQVGHEELGGADMHCRDSGVTDHIAEDDAHGLSIVRDIVRNLGNLPTQRWDVADSVEPLYPIEEIYGIVNKDTKVPTDNREILARLVDGSNFDEFKTNYGNTLMCGFAKIHGFEVGILANDGVMFSESAKKGTHFINLCCQRDIPLLFIADVPGFMVGEHAERGGIAKDGAKFITAMSSAKVPKYTLITGGSYGAGYLAMCGRPFKPNAMLAWPSGRSGIMGPEQVANTLATVREDILKREGKTWTDEEREEFKAPHRKRFEDSEDAYNFASKLWYDAVIDPVETREVLALLLDLAGRSPKIETKFGVFRQ
ncbi:MAG: methylcrotonoyl-CoA carboxylase [Cycloclasticus sp.]|jgi:3-methylcrotonyl-CoA carboxylase beta subunit|nr:methylcrotonoyl-CoA carboxylase [Cycloclasticus sp.]MEE4291258.1 carboxyl transferase domain-containing protein [Cycloclasticus sp.]